MRFDHDAERVGETIGLTTERFEKLARDAAEEFAACDKHSAGIESLICAMRNEFLGDSAAEPSQYEAALAAIAFSVGATWGEAQLVTKARTVLRTVSALVESGAPSEMVASSALVVLAAIARVKLEHDE